MVACRLKIGGQNQARAAVDEAKQCIALNESWAKGHVRLASAYIALGGHSNDACNSLQRAIALDPSNTVARQMLMKELRRDHIDSRQRSTTPGSATTSHPPPTAPPEEDILEEEPTINDIDESLSWNDRLKSYYVQTISWYHSQTDDAKNFMQVGLVILALYVAFGGRFGLDRIFSGSHHQHQGNYEAGNAYDRYRRSASDNSHDSKRSPYQDDYSYDSYQPRQQHSTGRFNLFSGSPTSVVILCAGLYFCHRNGINPFHAIMVLNMMGGGGAGRMRRGFGGGMGGGYGGGMGYGRGGFRRNR